MDGISSDVTVEKDPHPRVAPSDPTIKDLFAKSGNECAFPGCRHPIVDELGNVVAQIAHIKGVKPSSPRFDPTVDPKHLADRSNLLLLCYAHHQVTNDESMYPVPRMRDMKEAHERRFGGLVAGLQGTIEDQTKYAAAYPPTNMARYREVTGLSGPDDDEQVSSTQQQYVTLLEHLAKLPPDSRSVLATIVERGGDGGMGSWSMAGIFSLPLPELREVLGLNDKQLLDQLAILKNHDLADVDYEGSEESLFRPVVVAKMGIAGLDDYLLAELKHVANETGTPLSRAIVSLDFRLLDD